MAGRKFDPSRKAHVDSPERRRYLDPDAILDQLGIRSGMRVADVGAGTGYFTLPLAGISGGAVKVYAVDISREMLEAVRVAAKGLGNIELLLANEDEIPLASDLLDLALMVNVLHELEGTGTLKEVRRSLRPGGKLAVVDWRRRLMLEGPPLWHRLSEDMAVELVMGVGFDFYNWFEAGPHHYGLLFKKA
jgi:ubiquinone/menaquinone biosynthesis C-methylase UbiE